MSFRHIRLAAVLVMLAALGSCKINTINSFPQSSADVRYASFMPDVAAVNVNVANSSAWTNVAFQSVTAYLTYPNAQTNIGVYDADTGTSIAQSSASLSAQASYTLVGFGTEIDPHLLFQDDSLPSLGSGNTLLRVTHIGTGFGVIDVYVTSADADITSMDPTFTLSYGGNTSFQRITAGTYRIRATIYSTKTLMYDSGPIDLAVNAAQNVFLYGIQQSHAFNAMQVNVAGGTTQPLPSTVTALRTVNAAYQTGAMDLKVDGTVLFSNLAYQKAVAGYQPITSGQRVFTVQAYAAPDTDVASLTSTVDPSTDVTLLVSGPSDALVITPMTDFNRPPDSSTARLRVVNASPDVAAFDVAVDDKVVATNVTYPGPSIYFDVSSGNHTVKALMPGTTTPVLTFPSDSFGGNNVYSLYLMGPSSALVQLITQDNVQGD